MGKLQKLDAQRKEIQSPVNLWKGSQLTRLSGNKYLKKKTCQISKNFERLIVSTVDEDVEKQVFSHAVVKG